MKTSRIVAALILLVTFVLSLVSPAKADLRDKLSILTFSAPVELPGVTLPAGTYAFKLADLQSNRQVVQVWSEDRTHLHATILTISAYTPRRSEKTIIRFSETAAGAPAAIKEWFYPGNQYGWAFVYPKTRAVELAKESNQAVPSMPDELAADTTEATANLTDAKVVALENSQLKAEEPGGQEVEIAEAFGVPSLGITELPKTASILPNLFVAGTLLAMAGMLVGWIAKRTV